MERASRPAQGRTAGIGRAWKHTHHARGPFSWRVTQPRRCPGLNDALVVAPGHLFFGRHCLGVEPVAGCCCLRRPCGDVRRLLCRLCDGPGPVRLHRRVCLRTASGGRGWLDAQLVESNRRKVVGGAPLRLGSIGWGSTAAGGVGVMRERGEEAARLQRQAGLVALTGMLVADHRRALCMLSGASRERPCRERESVGAWGGERRRGCVGNGRLFVWV